MSTLVTGGSGFLGEHVVRALLGRGVPVVRVLVRGTYEPDFGERAGDVEIVRGDVTDESVLARALDGCGDVYHLAGLVSRDPDAAAAMMRVHVEGTKRLLQAAAHAGARRVVVASSSGTVAVSRTPEPIADEDSGYATEIVSGWPYYLSKIYQEKVALEWGATPGPREDKRGAAAKKAPPRDAGGGATNKASPEVVFVNPSLLLGPGDRRLSSTGDVLRFLRREFPVVPSGGVNFVDVRDAAEGTVMAMDAGRPGQRYLLGGPNWSGAEFFGRLERASKVPAPRLRLPDRWARAGAVLVEQLYKKLDRESPVDRITVEMSQVYWYCDSSRAERALGFHARDPGETLDETIRYLRRHHRI